VACAAEHRGIVYLRTTRGATPVIYAADEPLRIGGSRVLRTGDDDMATVVAAGVTVHEALAAADALAADGIAVRIVDAYSVKPVDRETLLRAAADTGVVLTVEDHGPEGGLGEAVAAVLVGTPIAFRSLAVRDKPRSGTPSELRAFEGIDRDAIVAAVRELLA
jgi:transketolase